MQFALKVLISALLIAGASELGKRSSAMGAVLASLPLTSILALTWLFSETRDKTAVGAMSTGVFWYTLPSLPMFLILPALLKRGIGYGWAIAASCAVTSLLYGAVSWVARSAGLRL